MIGPCHHTDVREISTSQIDRLGERLRGTDVISGDDLALLQAFRAEHEEALLHVQTRIERALPRVDPTARIKTIQTLHDKLRRQPTKLSRIQDIAGVRIVQDMDLLEQDEVVADLAREFRPSRVVDRRARPMHGYRAVHVVVLIGRCSIEIQVRTRSQHLWAEVVERLGDRWGRDIRYGGDPADSGRTVDGSTTRSEFWGLVQDTGRSLAVIEELAANQSMAVDSGEAPPGMGHGTLSQIQADIHEVLGEWLEYISTTPEL